MKHLATLLGLLIFTTSYGQKKQCSCDRDTLMNGATINCETIILKNKSKLYWQFNCDRIWLTLENAKGQKFIIDTMEVELYGYIYRLGFHLIKEYENSLLFRSGCPANGPCIYTLIDKMNGRTIKQFDQLICIDTDVQWKNPHKYNFDFVVYLSDNLDHLIVYYIDSKKTVKVPFKEKLTAVIPQTQFDKMSLEKNVLTLYYTDDEKNKMFKIDLNNKQ